MPRLNDVRIEHRGIKPLLQLQPVFARISQRASAATKGILGVSKPRTG